MLNQGDLDTLEPQVMEINPAHLLIRQLNSARKQAAQQEQAALVAAQLFDNVLLNAGILDEPRAMVGRVEQIMGLALPSLQDGGSAGEQA